MKCLKYNWLLMWHFLDYHNKLDNLHKSRYSDNRHGLVSEKRRELKAWYYDKRYQIYLDVYGE